MKFGLIGHPIEHSLSPALFKAGYNGMYPYDLIMTDSFEEAYSRFLEGYDGINVTAPFKELALRKADVVSEECRLVGATNLLIKTPDGVTAYNSDFLGLVSILESVEVSGEGAKRTPPTPSSWVPPPAARGVARFSRPHPKPQNAATRRVLIIGWGGAGKAAKAAAEALGYETAVINRTQHSPEIKPLSAFKEEFRKADIIIYNLPVRILELDELTDEYLSECGPKTVIEANYRNPSFNKNLLSMMRNADPCNRYIGGRTWLLMQAVTGYEIFTGETPDLGQMSACL